MVIDGRKLAEELKQEIRQQISILSQKGIIPKIAIVTVGPEGAWMTYVRQKIRFAEKNNIRHALIHLDRADTDTLVKTIKQLNSDQTVHGIIVQRPVPYGIDRQAIVTAIDPAKDIDGFRDDSHFKSPIWLAILKILEWIHAREMAGLNPGKDAHPTFKDWIKEKTWVVVGKGETGGKPTISELKKRGIEPKVIDSKTENPGAILKQGEIVVSGAGRRVVEGKNLKPGVFLIGIGIHRGEDGELHGDYDEENVKEIAAYYTPTPGGVGPLNLSFLYKNLIDAITHSLNF